MQNRLRGWRLCAPALAVWLITGAAKAAPSPTDDTTLIALPAVLGRTLERNPDLATYPHRLRAADAAVLQAGLRPQAELSVEVENLAGDAPADGVNGAEITLALSQMIELGGKRQQRTDVASLALDSERLAYDQARLEVLGDAVRRYIALAAAQARVNLAERTQALAGQAEQAARRRVRAGAAPDSELTRLTLATRQAEIERRAEVERDAASQQLAALWGETDAAHLRPATGLRPLPDLPPLARIRAQLAQAPDLLRLASDTRLREAQARLAQAEGRRDVTVSLGARHARLSDENTLLLGVSTPLNLRNPNRGNVARAEAALAESQARLAARRIELTAALEALYRSLSLLREELALIDDTALPLARDLYRDIEAGYSAGRYSLLTLINARQEQLALEQRAIDLATRFHQQRNELERLTGLDFADAGAQENTP
ncbi:cobalt/zinc/cadmium efflux RND transporter outermembrane protein [Alcanivorax sp. S71-1-4]|uniref:TolC family protein n=1 Tax=Alcanivorax sp. S71-1-4 TaxID=1177159 RepID=UPI0013581821|nr:TolC family protein [Alcanivorax sp. S71-1-4]KAF0809149.1 cobalt/zinc/cadmium efflux RND transporter outermembrane protein [Alcanivorax sp. S71-1-4]